MYNIIYLATEFHFEKCFEKRRKVTFRINSTQNPKGNFILFSNYLFVLYSLLDNSLSLGFNITKKKNVFLTN